MTDKEVLRILDRLVGSAKHAVLAYTSADATPVQRVMSPTILHGREGYLYALTSPKFTKTEALRANPHVSWLVQDAALQEVAIVEGTVTFVENPQMKAAVTEAIGGNLATFWGINKDESNLVVLETTIINIEYTKPAAKVHERVKIA